MHIILRSCQLFSPNKKVASPPLDSEPVVMSEGGSKIPFFASRLPEATALRLAARGCDAGQLVQI